MRLIFDGLKVRPGWLVLLSLALLLNSARGSAKEAPSQEPVDWQERLERLRAVPYVDFSDSLVGEDQSGVIIFQAGKACEGYNLYCSNLEGEGLLLDMEGRVVHRWEALPVGGPGKYQYVAMLDDGDLLFVKEHMNLLRLNWHSELVWKKELAVHHDVTQASDGSLYTIIRQHGLHRSIVVWFDTIVHLTEAGEEIDRWSTYDHLAEIKSVFDTRSFLDTVLDSALGGRPPRAERIVFRKMVAGLRERLDYFHINAVSELPATALGENDSPFQQGSLLICSRRVNQIAVLEKDTYRVLWAWGEGELEGPHHPTMLEDGHILIFDNGTRRKYSRVVELDPASETIVWEYRAEPPEDFYTPGRGSAQRLPNGNTLICESDRGRTFEVTREGEVVWEWLNPAIGKGRRRTLYRMMRLPKDAVDKLLEGQQQWE